MHGLNSLVSNNHVDNNLKEMLVYVYFGSIITNRPKKRLLKAMAKWHTIHISVLHNINIGSVQILMSS